MIIASASSTRRFSSLRDRPLLAQAVGDVVEHVQVRKDRVRLEHHVRRPLVGRDQRRRLIVDEDLALGRKFEPRDHAQQRGLAAARRAQQREELAAFDVERHAVDGLDAAGELFGHILDADDVIGHGERYATPTLRSPLVPSWRTHSAKNDQHAREIRIKAPSASTPGSLFGKRSWLQI